jgi:hypothetical protein
MPIGTDPLGAIRVELVNAARRRSAARRRRQRVTTVVATGLVSLLSVAGAGALVAGSTGVDAIDEFLGRVDSVEKGAPSDSFSTNDATRSEAPAAPDSASKPLESLHGGGETTAIVAYTSRSGSICLAVSRPHGEGAGEAREGWGCMAPDALSRDLAGEPVLLADVRSATMTTASGYAAEEVEAITVRGPGGPFAVRLGAPWKPDAQGAVPLRPFVAVGSAGEAIRPGQAGDLRNYSFEARMEDGETVEVRP